MHPDLNLSEIALVALMALGCGVLLERLKQPAVLGYILAGIILGPSVFGLVENRELVGALAEMGMLMLLFLVGLELSLDDLKKTWKVASVSTAGQIFISCLVVIPLTTLFGYSFAYSLLLSFAIALSSTAVAMNMIRGLGIQQTAAGRISIGILIAQDLAVIPMILILRGLEGGTVGSTIVLKIFASLSILGGIIWFFGRRQKISLPFAKVVSGHEDLMPLTNLAFCFGMAAIIGYMGLSAAYGAFLAGLILANTKHNQTLLKQAKPIQSVLMMVFFLSIGLLIDLPFLWDQFAKVLLLLLVITFGKTVLNITLLLFLRQPSSHAFLSGLLLAQMGEFAFLLTTVGIDVGILDEHGKSMVVSLAALSLAFSPLWFACARRVMAFRNKPLLTTDELLHTAFKTEMKHIRKTYIKIEATTREGVQWCISCFKDKSKANDNE